MKSTEIRQRFLAFFEKRGHKIIPSASLIPENDPSVLFNTAGMQPLVPYLLGEMHPMGNRIADIQKCVRTGDLDDIGDNRHFSFFEMMGNWSLGDYFKKEAITWSYEFLTSKEEGLGLDPNRLYVTIFEGDVNADFDQESKNIWMDSGIPENRIYVLPADDNWWSPGDNGPCGPCSEMFYDMSGTVGDLDKDGFINAVKAESIIEIWNDVFMEYEKKDGKVIGKLKQKNVDTGAGLERMTAVMQGKNTAYDTDIFKDLIEKISELSELKDGTLETGKLKRIIADHTRTAIFLIADGVIPSSTGQGYILRRLLRRAIRCGHALTMNHDYQQFVDIVEKQYKNTYENISENKERIVSELQKEFNKFIKTLSLGLKEFEKISSSLGENIVGGHMIGGGGGIMSGETAFNLFSTYGFPIELTQEVAREKDLDVDMEEFNLKMKEHQEKSRSASAGMFKGGLANTNEKTTRLHTAHHLLLAALQQVLGGTVHQKGSNITEERLRIDFSFDRKLTDEEKLEIEKIVNTNIEKDLTVVKREVPKVEAEAIGAEMEFGAKYPDIVSVYFIEDATGNAVSKEFCGGPHVTHTKEIGKFKILKEEAVQAGVRRIKAIVE